MGIIRAAAKSLSSGLADQWLEVIEPSDMGAQTLMTPVSYTHLYGYGKDI